jgi:hypothetical protein
VYNAHPDDNSFSLVFLPPSLKISLSDGILYILQKSPPVLSAFPSPSGLL